MLKLSCPTCNSGSKVVSLKRLKSLHDNNTIMAYVKKWYTDEKNKEHSMLICLSCGSIIDIFTPFSKTYNLIFKAAMPFDIISTSLSKEIDTKCMKFYKIDSSVSKREFAHFTLNIPFEVIDLLIATGHLPSSYTRTRKDDTYTQKEKNHIVSVNMNILMSQMQL